MAPLLDHLFAAAWQWITVIGLVGAICAARSRAGGRARRAALVFAATCAWLTLVLASAWLGATLAGRPGLVLALLATMLVPFAALAHPAVKGLVERHGLGPGPG